MRTAIMSAPCARLRPTPLPSPWPLHRFPAPIEGLGVVGLAKDPDGYVI
jgi:hypothetical protein